MSAIEGTHVPMFTEELDRLRLALHETQEMVTHRDRLIRDLRDQLQQKDVKYANLERVMAQKEQQLSDATTLVSDLRRRADQVPMLESQANEALDAAKKADERLESLQKRFDTASRKIDQLSDGLSVSNAEKTTLEAEIEPFRKLIAAMKDREDADRRMVEQLEFLRRD